MLRAHDRINQWAFYGLPLHRKIVSAAPQGTCHYEVGVSPTRADFAMMPLAAAEKILLAPSGELWYNGGREQNRVDFPNESGGSR